MSETIDISSFSIDDETRSKYAFFVRQAVFVAEQGVDPLLEYDENDKIATHYLVTFNAMPIGAARWRRTDSGIKLERFAILKEHRNMHVGAKLLEKILSDVLLFNMPIYLHSQTTAIKFYERYGFIKSGKLFYEAGIEHYKMFLEKN